MQRLLTEAYDEFELEERETAEVPVSVYVDSLSAIRRSSPTRRVAFVQHALGGKTYLLNQIVRSL